MRLRLARSRPILSVEGFPYIQGPQSLMPTVTANDIDIYYEEHGSGEPLLLIMGWGGNAATWAPQLPGLSERYRVITFDNRGAGRTSAPDGPYSTQQMAADTIALLDALDVPRVHVFGISMGGMIAQELALAAPDRVGALILGCTSPGGEAALGAGALRGEIRDFQEKGDAYQDFEWFSEFLKRLWTDDALARSDAYLQDFVLSLIRFPAPAHGLRAQGAAVAGHDAYDRLFAIRNPTLVITGDEDGLIDPGNSRVLVERLRNAQLWLFPGLRHAFHLERPDLVNPAILSFLETAIHA